MIVSITSRFSWACLALLVAGSSACHSGSDAAADEESETPASVSAHTAVATAGPFVVTVGSIGSVVARPSHYASLSAPAATRVARVYAVVGQHVAAGAPLVELEQAGFVAQARGADAAVTAAQQAYDRAQRLVREGIIPRKDLDQATSDLEQARAAAVTAQRARDLSVLRSPIAGVVTRMDATLGASVDVNQPLVDVADPSAFDLLFAVSPADAARIRPGNMVALYSGQSMTGGGLGTAVVADIGVGVDSASRAVSVRARLTAPSRALRLGETVFGQIAVETHRDAISIPVEALVPDADGFKVFVVDTSGTAHERAVTVGARTETRAEILDGLQANERVVTYGAFGVEDSAQVTSPDSDPAEKP